MKNGKIFVRVYYYDTSSRKFEGGVLYAYNPDGELLWETKGRFRSYFSIVGIDDKYVILCDRGEKHGNGSITLDQIYILDLKDGTEITNFYVNYYYLSLFSFGNNKLYAKNENQHIICLDISTGNLIWEYPSSEIDQIRTIWNPILYKNRVYFSVHDDSFTYCLDASTGQLIWQKRIDNPTSICIVGEKLLINSVLKDESNRVFNSTIYCYHEDTGNLLWKHEAPLSLYLYKIGVQEDLVFISGRDDFNNIPYIYTLNISNGKFVWVKELKGYNIGYPIAADGKVFVGPSGKHSSSSEGQKLTEGGNIFCFNTTNGDNIWSFSFPSFFNTNNVEDYAGIGYLQIVQGKLFATARVFWKSDQNSQGGQFRGYFFCFGGGVVVDKAVMSDTHANLGSQQRIALHAVWDHDNTDVTVGRIFVNEVGYNPNSTGWISFSYDSQTIQNITFEITSVDCDSTTSFVQIPMNLHIVWDRIKIVDGGTSQNLSELGNEEIVWFKAVYEYDNNLFDSTKGTLYVNDEAMTWDEVNGRWSRTVTSNTEGEEEYKISRVDDKQFGLSQINDTVGPLFIEWRSFTSLWLMTNQTTVIALVAVIVISSLSIGWIIKKRRFEKSQLEKGFIKYEGRWGTKKEVQQWKGEAERKEEIERMEKIRIEERKTMRRMEGVILFCPNCNRDLSKLPSDIRNCPYCSKEIERRVVVIERKVEKPSTYWYLVPFFFTIIGGILAYIAVKDDDRNMAKNLVLFGICMSAIWFMLYTLFRAYFFYVGIRGYL